MPDAREVAVKTLGKILCKGEFSDQAFERYARGLSSPDRALAWEIIIGVLKHLYLIDYIIKKRANTAHLSPTIMNILRIGTYQILYLEKIPDYASISTSVEITKKLAGQKMAGFVNAVLRGICGDKGNTSICARNKVEILSIKHSFPVWIVRSFIKNFGEKRAEEILRYSNLRPEIFIRVNLAKISREKLLGLLNNNGISAKAVEGFPAYISLGYPKQKINEIVGYKEGYFTVQDPSFSIPIQILEVRENERILEIGASPGGKSTHIAEIAGKGSIIVGLDLPSRIKQFVENLKRLGHKNIFVVAGDGTKPPFKDRTFDRILVDAPCSSFGIVRRHPEIRYIKTENDLKKLSGLQKNLVRSAYRLLKKGGILVYTTCTLTREENEDVAHYIARLGMKIEPPHKLIPPELITDEGFVLALPSRFDGFFCARFVKL